MPGRRETRYNSVHEAIRHGDVQELQAMVKAGASVNELDDSKDRFTPMHWSCYVGALECLHWLLWHSADTTVTTPRGWTPAHIAAIRGQDACIQALANNGANLCAKDLRGSTPAHMAAGHGNSFTLHSILRGGVEVNSIDRNGWTPVHCAAFHGRLGCLQLLIRWGGNLDETDNHGNTPAHLAATEGHLPCLKFMVSDGANPTHVLGARNDNGETPKMLAQQFYKENVMEYISNIEWERDHPEEAENLAFPAHVAAYTGDLSHLRMLLENGIVNINERDNKGGTPAHKAAGQGHIEVLQWLIEMGANVKIANSAGETPKDVARRFAQLAALKLLKGNTDVDSEDSDAAVISDNFGSEEEHGASTVCVYDFGDEDDEDRQGSGEDGGKGNDGDSDDDFSTPYGGNTEGEGLHVTKKQMIESRGRAKKKMEELDRLFEIAKKNYVQLGGKLPEDKRRLKEDRDMKRTIGELEAQLDYERLRRERLEGQLDEYRREINHLHGQLDDSAQDSQDSDTERERVRRRKKTNKKKSHRDDGVFVRRTVNTPKKQVRKSNFKIL